MRMLMSLSRFTVAARTKATYYQRTLTHSTLMRDFEIRLLSSQDLETTMDHFNQGFAAQEVPGRHLGIDSKDLMEYMKPWVKSCLLHGASYGAYDKANGEMIGASLNVLGTKELPPPPDQSSDDIPLKIKQLDLILTSPCPNGAEAELGTPRYFEMILIYVLDGYANRGLGAQLAKMNLESAKEFGCEFVVASSSSAFSRKIAERLGLKLVREVMYEDYVDPITGEKIMQGVDKPHRSVALFVLKL